MERVLRLSEQELAALTSLLLEESGRMGDREFLDSPLWAVYEKCRKARQ